MSDSKNETLDLFQIVENELEDFEESTKKETKRTFNFWTPTLEKGEDRKVYKLRFLPNLKYDLLSDKYYVTKHEHYVNHTDFGGMYDCQKDVGEKCPLCTTYWKLVKSKNVVQKELSDNIKWQEQNFSYILMIDNPDDPTTNGTIMVYKFGKQILTKIEEEKKDGVVVFNPVNGKDFKLVVTRKGGFVNYENSHFFESKPMFKIKKEQEEFQDLYNQFIVELPLNTFKSEKWTDDKSKDVSNLIDEFLGIETDMSDLTSKNDDDESDLPDDLDDLDLHNMN